MIKAPSSLPYLCISIIHRRHPSLSSNHVGMIRGMRPPLALDETFCCHQTTNRHLHTHYHQLIYCIIVNVVIVIIVSTTITQAAHVQDSPTEARCIDSFIYTRKHVGVNLEIGVGVLKKQME